MMNINCGLGAAAAGKLVYSTNVPVESPFLKKKGWGGVLAANHCLKESMTEWT